MVDGKTKLVDELIQFIDDGSRLAEDYWDMCDEVTEVYDGNYSGAGGTGGKNPIKSNILYTETRKNISRLILPADFKFLCEPSNSNNDIDIQSSNTGQAILKHYWYSQKQWKMYRKVILDSILYDRGYTKSAFKPTKKAKDAFEAVDSEGANRYESQPFLERIKYRNFIIEDGFESIDDAYRTGGMIGVRADVHIDWVKANKSYKNKHLVKASMPYRGMDPLKEEDSERSGRKNKYVITWQLYRAPSDAHPKGQFFIVSPNDKVVLYQQNELPYKGLGFPVTELVFNEPQNNYYGTPLSSRSLNSVFEYEMFETKVKNLVEGIKTIIMGNTKNSAEDINKQIALIRDIAYVDGDNMFQNGAKPETYSFSPETSAVERASLASLSRFKSIYSSAETTSPFQKEQIATQIRADAAGALQEINDSRINVNQFCIANAENMLLLTKAYTPRREQVRITRQVDMTIQDEKEITLAGNYSTTINTSPLKDMSMGEEVNAQMGLLNILIQLQSLPQTADRIDIIPVVESVSNSLGMPSSRVIKPSNMSNPTFENSMLVLGMAIQARPTDNHIKHLQVHQRYLDQLAQFTENPEAMEKLTFDYEVAMKAISAHVDMHVQLGDLQSQGNENSGAWKQAKNAVNNSRQSQANSFSNDGALGIQGSGGSFNG